MNMFGYAWGFFGFLGVVQMYEGRTVLAILFGTGALICMFIALTKDKD